MGDDLGTLIDNIHNPQTARTETDGKTRRRFLLRYYRVFNIEQCELPQTVFDKLPKTETHEHAPIETAERIIADQAVIANAALAFGLAEHQLPSLFSLAANWMKRLRSDVEVSAAFIRAR